MPKMLFMGTNDPYWPVDAVKNYIDSIPGENHITYIPNAGHGMGDKKQAFATLSAFLGTTVTKGNYHTCDYKIVQNGNKAAITVETSPEALVDAYLWSTTSTDQDFRNEEWKSVSLNAANKPVVQVEVDLPKSGFKAFYVDLKYKSPFGNDYTQSTRIFVLTDKKVLLKEN
jgi:PhoPQ-activated pathogenicity-related protein